MVELTVSVESGVMVAGETFSCLLNFANTSAHPQTVAWAGAQLHCQCNFKKDVVRLPSRERNKSVSSPVTTTAFFPSRGEKGVTVLSTPSVVLLCNVTLQPGDTHSVVYREQLPMGGPPSFNGRLVRYIYKLAVGAQKPNCPTQITRLPVWVVTVPKHLQSPCVSTPSVSNPFIVGREKQSTSVNGLEAVAAEASRRTSSSTTLMTSGEVLGRILLFRAAYRLGDEVVTVFDCSQSTQPCLQVTSSLLCEETVQEKCVQPAATLKSVTTTISQETKCCQNTAITQFSLPIPSSLTQAFESDTVRVQWRVHYQILFSRQPWSELTSSSQPAGVLGTRAELLEGPQFPAAESVTWEVPITVLPSLQHSQQRQHPHSLTL